MAEPMVSVGRVVHYVPTLEQSEASAHCAAIVTAVDADAAVVSVCVFVPSHAWQIRHRPDLIPELRLRHQFHPAGLSWQDAVPWDDACAPGTWHWPERV